MRITHAHREPLGTWLGKSMTNPVVSNTTPLISLAEVGLLDVLRVLYTELWIPQAVFNEYHAGVASHPQRPILSSFPWISTHSVPADPLVPTTLDAGETEALALARTANARLILMDEQRGRAAAMRLGLIVTGSLGMLLEAKARSLIPVVRPYLVIRWRRRGDTSALACGRMCSHWQANRPPMPRSLALRVPDHRGRAGARWR